MIISEKQIVLLLDVLKDSLRASKRDFVLTFEQRGLLYQNILEQQNDRAKDVTE